jgi:hypothetical protein
MSPAELSALKKMAEAKRASRNAAKSGTVKNGAAKNGAGKAKASVNAAKETAPGGANTAASVAEKCQQLREEGLTEAQIMAVAAMLLGTK